MKIKKDISKKLFNCCCSIFIFFFILPTLSQPVPFPQKNQVEKGYDTTAHQMLKNESEINAVDEKMYNLLDIIISEAKEQIKFEPGDNIDQKSAIQILKIIDNIVINNNIVYPAKDLVLLLSDGLKPQRISDNEINHFVNKLQNRRRERHILKHRTENHYIADCDITSFMYLGVADALKLPIALVEVPKHNFVRWVFKDNSYINWETMYGTVEGDNYYKEWYKLKDEWIENRLFLVSMNREQVLAYHYRLMGIAWREKNEYDKAFSCFKKGLVLNPKCPELKNEVAWVHISNPKYFDKIIALKLAKEAAIYNRGYILDTLACSYAEHGHFELAIKIEKDAIRFSVKQEDIEAFEKRLEGFKAKKTYLQQKSETIKNKKECP